MSYRDDDKNGNLLGALITLIFQIVFIYYLFKFLVYVLELTIKLLEITFEFLSKLIVFLYKLSSNYIKKKLQSNSINSNDLDSKSNNFSSTSKTSKHLIKNGVHWNDGRLLDAINHPPQVKPKRNFVYDKETYAFKAKYPFVVVDVDPIYRSQFIKECEWLEKKLGYFPSEADQIAILNSFVS